MLYAANMLCLNTNEYNYKCMLFMTARVDTVLLPCLLTSKSQTHLRLMLRRMREIEKSNNGTAKVRFNGQFIRISV